MVTGGSGFLGSFVCEELLDRGKETIFVPLSSDYDLTLQEDVRRLYEDFEPTLVIHLAAVVGGIGANRNNPATFLHDNLVMGTHLMEYGRRYGIEKFVTVGTVCSYPADAPIPFEETSLWDGYPERTNAPYGLAKRMLLEQARTYYEQYELNSVYLIPVNLFGPRENFDLETSHVIPALIRKFSEARRTGKASVTVWGSGEPTREFLFVRDAAKAVVDAAERLSEPLPINLGSGEETSIRDVVNEIKSSVEYGGDVTWDTNKPDGQSRRYVDTSRAEKFLEWQSETGFSAGLSTTIAWYRENRKRILASPDITGFRTPENQPSGIVHQPREGNRHRE